MLPQISNICKYLFGIIYLRRQSMQWWQFEYFQIKVDEYINKLALYFPMEMYIGIPRIGGGSLKSHHHQILFSYKCIAKPQALHREGKACAAILSTFFVLLFHFPFFVTALVCYLEKWFYIIIIAYNAFAIQKRKFVNLVLVNQKRIRCRRMRRKKILESFVIKI